MQIERKNTVAENIVGGSILFLILALVGITIFYFFLGGQKYIEDWHKQQFSAHCSKAIENLRKNDDRGFNAELSEAKKELSQIKYWDDRQLARHFEAAAVLTMPNPEFQKALNLLGENLKNPDATHMLFSERLYRLAASIRQNHIQGDPAGYLNCLNSWASSYIVVGDYEKASKKTLEAMDLMHKRGLANNFIADRVDSCINAAKIEEHNGHLDSAQSLLADAATCCTGDQSMSKTTRFNEALAAIAGTENKPSLNTQIFCVTKLSDIAEKRGDLKTALAARKKVDALKAVVAQEQEDEHESERNQKELDDEASEHRDD